MINDIGRPLFGNVFARIFGVDELNAVKQLAPEVLPVTSPWERPEFWAFLGGRLCCDFSDVGAVAAQLGAVTLTNPANSGIMAIVTRVVVGVATTPVWGVNLGDGGGTELGLSRDMRTQRAGGAAGLAAGVGCRLNATTNVSFAWIRSGVLQPGVNDLEVILSPGSMFGVGGDTVNTQLRCGLEWRERPAMDDELILF